MNESRWQPAVSQLDTLEALVLAGVLKGAPPDCVWAALVLLPALQLAPLWLLRPHLLPHQGGQAQLPRGDKQAHFPLYGVEMLVMDLGNSRNEIKE